MFHFNANAQQLPPVIPALLPPPPSVSFPHGIPLHEFTRNVLNDILRVEYVLSPELLAAQQLVAPSAKLPPKTARALLERVLDKQGFQIEVLDNVYYVNRKSDVVVDVAGKSRLIFRPVNRPVSYFAAALPDIYPEAKFSFQKVDKGAGGADAAGLDFFLAYVDENQRDDLQRTVAELDTPLQQVLIRAKILEVSNDGRSGSGVRLAATVLNQKLGFRIGTDNIPAQAIVFKASNGSMTVDAAFGVFAGESAFKTVAEPYALTTHAQSASLLGGYSFPVATTVKNNQGESTTSIEYRDVGTTLTVLPQVLGSTVSLSVTIDLSDVSQTALGDTTAPTLITRKFNSQVLLGAGQAAIIGGITSTRSASSNNKLFGFNFSDDKQDTRSELVVILYAEVLDADSAVQINYADVEERSFKSL